MKILQFIRSLTSGGAEKVVSDYVLNLNVNNECEISVFNHLENRSPIEDILDREKIEVHYLTDNISKKNSCLEKVFVFFMRRRRLVSYLKNNDFDIIHVHLDLNKYWMLNKKFLENKKLFHTVHNEPQKNFESGLGSKIEKLCTKHLIKKYNMRLIALHEDMRIELNEMFGVDNTAVINNGIDMERFNPELYKQNASLFKISLGFNQDDFIVGNIGRLVEQKNHKFLLEIFAQLTKEKENAKLLLVGAGSLKEDICKQIEALGIKDRVVILENRKDIPELLSIMDVFLFPSLYEGLGIVLIEAQAMGIKCVVSDPVPTAAHVSKQYISLSLEESAEVWSNTILNENISSNPSLSLKDYDMKEVIKKLEALYEES